MLSVKRGMLSDRSSQKRTAPSRISFDTSNPSVKQRIEAGMGATQPATPSSFGSLHGTSSGSQQMTGQMPFSGGSTGSYTGNVGLYSTPHAPIMSTGLGQQPGSTGLYRSGPGGMVGASSVNFSGAPSVKPSPLATQSGLPTTVQQAPVVNVTSALPQGYCNSRLPNLNPTPSPTPTTTLSPVRESVPQQESSSKEAFVPVIKGKHTSDHITEKLESPVLVDDDDDIEPVVATENEEAVEPLDLPSKVTPRKPHLENSYAEDSGADGIDVSDDNLTLWTDLVWEMQPKFFKKMPKEEMKHQVYSFLCEHMSLEKAQVCYLNSIKDGMQYAIPNELYDEFDGFLERLIAFEKKHGYLKPAVNFPRIQKCRRDDESDTFEPLNVSTTLKRTPIYEPGQQSPVAGTPWIDLVREKYPNVTIDYQDMIRSTELFFVKQKIKSKSTISACGLHCNVIPFGKEAEFLRNFKSLYVKSRIVDKDAPIDEDEPLSSIADETSQLVSLIEDERIANKTIKDFYVFSWRDLVSVRHQNSDLLQVRSLVYKRILQGVDSFVKEHIPRLGCTVDECQIRSTNGSITSFGIPIQFVDAFYSWFDKQLEDRFSKYSVQAPANSTASERQSNASSSSDTKKSSASSAMQSQSCGTLDGPSTKKHKTSEKSSRKKKKRKNNVADPPVFGGYTDLPSVLNVTPNEDPIANQEAPSFAFVDVVPRCTKGSDTSSQAPAQSDSVQLAASAVLGTVDLNVEPPADVSSKKKLLRYNLIITEMMPKFGDLSKEIRYAFKDKVKDFIVCKLGSESRLSENVIQLRAQGTAFSTYGICREWIPEFKKWCLQELRSLFGVEQVPIQAWEQSSILGSCKV